MVTKKLVGGMVLKARKGKNEKTTPTASKLIVIRLKRGRKDE